MDKVAFITAIVFHEDIAAIGYGETIWIIATHYVTQGLN